MGESLVALEKRTPGEGMGHAVAAGGGTCCDGSGAELDLQDLQSRRRGRSLLGCSTTKA